MASIDLEWIRLFLFKAFFGGGNSHGDHSQNGRMKNSEHNRQHRKEQWTMCFYNPIESLHLPCLSKAVFINNIFLFKKNLFFFIYFQEPKFMIWNSFIKKSPPSDGVNCKMVREQWFDPKGTRRRCNQALKHIVGSIMIFFSFFFLDLLAWIGSSEWRTITFMTEYGHIHTTLRTECIGFELHWECCFNQIHLLVYWIKKEI